MPKDRLLFSKEGRAKYISHLDLMRTFQRAFVRSDIPIKHTEGFNPHPFISIALPLSLGFESDWELLEFGLLEGVDRAAVPEKLNAALPEGVTVRECYPAQRPIKELAWLDYQILVEEVADPAGLRDAWGALLGQESWVVEKPSKKAKSGSVTVDICKLVKEFSFTEVENKGVLLEATVAAQNPGLNPNVMVKALTDACPQCAPGFVSYRRRRALDSGGEVFR